MVMRQERLGLAAFGAMLGTATLVGLGCAGRSSLTYGQEGPEERDKSQQAERVRAEESGSSTASIVPDQLVKSTHPHGEREEDRFLGQSEPVLLAVSEFSTSGAKTMPEWGKSIADQLCSRLSARRFKLVERSRLNRIIEERDLQSAGLVGGTLQSLTEASYVLVGSAHSEHGIEVTARLVEVATGRLVRRAWGRSKSLEQINIALDYVAAVLSSSDSDYIRLEADADLRVDEDLKQALDPPERVTHDGDALVIVIRSANDGGSEPQFYQKARQRLRERFVAFCQNELRLARSKSWLMDYCRRFEDCEDVTTRGAYTTFTFRVPIPN